MQEQIVDIIPDPYVKITKSGTKQIVNDNGFVLGRYSKIPKNLKFKHKAVNDRNQHLCGGWFVGPQVKYEEILRVEQGLKPLALCHPDSKEEAIKLKKEYTDKGFLATIYPNKAFKGKYDIIVSVNTTFGEFFDMDTLAEDYKKNKLFEEAENIKSRKDDHFSILHDELNMRILCDWQMPEISGLMFGYPIENTISRIKYGK
jgi:hypothetical protein